MILWIPKVTTEDINIRELQEEENALVAGRELFMRDIDLKLILFVLTATSFYAVGNYYIGKRLFERIQYRYTFNNKFFWAIFWVIAFSYVVSTLVGTYLPKYIGNTFLYIGIYYFAIASYLVIIFPLIDMVKIFNKRLGFLPKDQILKIALLSDIHLGDYMDVNRLKRLVTEVNKVSPDIILIAGDLVDSSIKPIIKYDMAKELGTLQSKYGTYFAFGNHDITQNKTNTLTELLESEGIKVLRDDYELINDSFYVVGRDDVAVSRIGRERKELKEITKKIDKSKPVIVIDHNPKEITEAYEEKIDLQVSGHTHKGQFIPYNLVTNRNYDMVYGYDKRDNFNIVVSSGYGTWGPPIRIGSRSEIVQINLSSNAEFVKEEISHWKNISIIQRSITDILISRTIFYMTSISCYTTIDTSLQLTLRGSLCLKPLFCGFLFLLNHLRKIYL